MMEPKKTIFQRAAEWGIPFGLYLACAAVASIFTDWFPPLSIIFWLMVLAIPVVVYYFQRRKFKEDDGFTEFSALWMMGILLFILGGIIASFIAYLVFQYGRPEFLYDMGRIILETNQKTPGIVDQTTADVIKDLVDKRLMPTPIDMVFSMFWFLTFGGSLVSALTAIIARSTPVRRRKQ